jgi:hypothetical protein
MEMRQAAATGGRLSAIELAAQIPLEDPVWYTFEGVISANLERIEHQRHDQ